MTDGSPRLVQLPLSPWSERARWVLDHHRVHYQSIVHVPVIGERRLRQLVGVPGQLATAPALLLPDAVLRDSWDIAQYAERHGSGAPLLPRAKEREVREWDELAARGMAAGRTLVMRAMLASPHALDETLPRPVPRSLRPWLRPITRRATRWFAQKYELPLDDEAGQLAQLRASLAALRAGLERSSPYLLGSFSYADIVMAVLLQGVSPVPHHYIPLGRATRLAWTRPELASEFSDLIAWRDRLYEEHRRLRGL